MRRIPCCLLLLGALLAPPATGADPALDTFDDAVPAPEPVSVEPYVSESGGDGFVLVTVRPVNLETVTGYRIWRSVFVSYAADSTGALVALEEPELTWIPWGQVEAIAGQELMKFVVAVLDDDQLALGITTEVTVDGVTRQSPIAELPPTGAPTAVTAVPWAAAKARLR